MKCWKCQRETGSDSIAECSACSGEQPLQFQEPAPYRYTLDWSAIKTVEDFRKVVESLRLHVFISDESEPLFQALRPWLKPTDQPPGGGPLPGAPS